MKLVVLLCIFMCIGGVVGHNITHILDGHLSYSRFKTMLVKYGLANQINSRETVTVLCPTNEALDALAPQFLSDPQNAFPLFSYHVLLDYFDLAKLKRITNGTDLIATLYQTTGSPPGNGGYLNVTDVKGVPMLALPSKGSPFFASVTGSIAAYPYNISVLSVSTVLIPGGLVAAAMSPEAAPAVNISHLIEQSGNYSTFLSLLVKYGINEIFQTHDVAPGITIFAPTNAAFKALPAGMLKNLTENETSALLQYHAVSSFYPTESIGGLVGTPVSSLASDEENHPGAYTFDVVNQGKKSLIDTGHNVVSLSTIIYSLNPVAIYGVSAVLMPTDLFGLTSQATRYASPPAPPPESTSLPSTTDDGSLAPNSNDLPGFAPHSLSCTSPLLALISLLTTVVFFLI